MRPNLKKCSALCVLFISLIAVGSISCKKRIVEPLKTKTAPTNEYIEYTDLAKSVVGKIKKFKNQLSDIDFVTRETSYMPLDSVIWNVEALFNVSYTFPESKCTETVKQKLVFTVNVNDEDEVLMREVYDLYEDVKTSVREVYANDGIVNDKSLFAVVVDEGMRHGSSVDIVVNVISGKVDTSTSSVLFENPFGPGDCWYFGEYGGSCLDPSILYDAAEILEDSINYHYAECRVPYSGYRGINVNLVEYGLIGSEYLDSNNEPYLFFWKEEDVPPYFLDYEDLNYYYNRELYVLLELLPEDLIAQGIMPIAPAFLDVDIQGIHIEISEVDYLIHRNSITYGCRLLIPEGELDPARNILN
ncbi:MAG: hypothetical protein ACI358_02150 [Candidatus Limimorpha sp.]